jgi:hypothetical protein
MLMVGFEEEGELVENEFECDEDETIGQSGIKDGSKLVLRVVGGDEAL